ncbi:hypothetical protein AURDEDRAFT_44141, partial [Auricularia subglabra TFB-10046 SS5]
GFFPCAPKRPSIAFSLPLLEFISIHSLNVAPNSSAWADTLQLFWQRRRYMPMTAESLRKRLGNAIHWYQVLVNRKDAHVQALIAGNSASAPITCLVDASSRIDTLLVDGVNHGLHVRSGPTHLSPTHVATGGSEDNAEVHHTTRADNARSSPSDLLKKRCPLCFGGPRP